MPRPTVESKPSWPLRIALLLAGLLVAIAAPAAWFLWPQENRVTETAELATQLLDKGGTPDKQAIRQLVKNVDQMPRDQLTKVWQAIRREWIDVRQTSMERYFSASSTEKPELLDAEIARLQALPELMLALNPDADPNKPPRIPKPRPSKKKGNEAAQKAEADRLAMNEQYDNAVIARAKARGVPLPVFR
jgi:hypothetical protein